jgi:hypothetical protein
MCLALEAEALSSDAFFQKFIAQERIEQSYAGETL